MMGGNLPLWVTLPGSVLLIVGGLVALTGSIGLLRLRTFYMRMHAPTLATTLGTACVVIASMLVSSALQDRPTARALLILVFIVMTMPVTSMLLMRAAVYRNAIRGMKEEE